MADAGLVAGDTGADVVAAPVARLVGHFGVADHGAGHAAGIRVAARDDLLGDLRLVDTPGDDDGNRYLLFDGAAEGRGITGFLGHRRHDVVGAGARRGTAGDDADIVDQPRRRQGLASGRGLVGFDPDTVQVFAGDPGTDRHAAADTLAHGGQHLAQKSQPVREAAAVAVCPKVAVGR